MNDVSFQLDLGGGAEILQELAMPAVKQAADAIAARASSMASATSSNPPQISVTTKVGVIRKGSRAIATVKVNAKDEHQKFIGQQALAKSKDAGRVA